MRPLETADVERVSQLVESSMTASYRLSPQQIEALAREVFDRETLEADIESAETVVQVAETEGEDDEPVIVGFVKGVRQDGWGEIRWLFVDPEHRGQGHGTELFEGATDQLEADGAEHIRATMLEANTEGHQFMERFGLERVGEDRVEIGGERLTNYVYAEPSADVEPVEDDEAAEAGDDTSFPETERRDGRRVATADDGTEAFVSEAEELSGTKAPFFVAYTDEAETDQFGMYCGNCGSLETTMDAMERVECEECGNTSASRGSDEYDDSYL